MDKLKESLISSPVLVYFDVNAVASDLYCDASGGSIGTVFSRLTRTVGYVKSVFILGN